MLLPSPARRLARALARALAAAGAALALDACEHPVAVVTPHVEAADLEVRDDGPDGAPGALLARTRDNRRWEGGPLALADGRARTVRVTALDFQGAPIALEGRAGVDVRAESEPAAAVVWEPLAGRARVTGLAPGRARVRLLVWHETHADLVTPWLDVDVRPSAAAAPSP